MDKNAIKKYAIWARRELIERVAQRAAMYGIMEKDHGDPEAESVDGRLLSPVEKRQRQALIQKIADKGYQQVIEEVAYTWFNRFAALRFMEVNGYLPTHIRVFTNDANEFKPQILSEAIHLELEGLNRNRVYELENENKREELFKYLLTVQCNALNEILPGMFQKIEDYTELLLPDNLLRQGSVIEQMITMIPEADWTDQVQIIGWLYQYYNTEPKDKVFADLKKNIKITKENIPAATQLFTPDWIVHYMVENSLGRLWLEGHPNDALKSQWKYYLDEAEQEPEVQAQLNEIRKEYAALKPEEIKVIDPCMGSGHILCVLFDVLVQIYEDYGYSAREAVVSIVENNLWGLDIDDRAAQLAYFAVMMKARQYDRRFFSKKVQPHVYGIHETNSFDNSHRKMLIGLLPIEQQKSFEYLLSAFIDVNEYGAILRLEDRNYLGLKKTVLENIYSRSNENDDINLWSASISSELINLIEQAIALSQRYHVVVSNPPYMNQKGMNAKLSVFLKNNYPKSSSDLYSAMISRGMEMIFPRYFLAMITMESWMFLSSYEEFRESEIYNRKINGLVHLPYLGKGGTSMGISFGTVAFIVCNVKMTGYRFDCQYIRYYECDNDGVPIEFPLYNERKSTTSSSELMQIPGFPLAYWVSKELLHSFSNTYIEDYAKPCKGIDTGNNDQFIRFWYEIDKHKFIKFSSNYKWVVFNKGGAYRKWYGNYDYVVNWDNGGHELIHYPKSNIRNPSYFFKSGLTWTLLNSGGNFGMRQLNNMAVFDANGLAMFPYDEENTYYLLGLFNSNVVRNYLSILSSTMAFVLGDIKRIPIIIDEKNKKKISDLSRDNVEIARRDWDSYETSWDFSEHPLKSRRYLADGLIKSSFEKYYMDVNNQFEEIKHNEEVINDILIHSYGLENDIHSEVPEELVTITHLYDSKNDIPSAMQNGTYIRTKGDIIRGFISYCVGCIFGRYSLDISGLVYAGGEWDSSKYITFFPDKDAILPFCDDEYFTDDIVGRFVKFVEVVYGERTLEDNLRFIADALGGKGAARDVIRNYFLNDFYADHLKVYQKRPIYWLFDSGKKNGFKCLIYMHRYQPDTIARIRTDYIHEQQSRYRTAIADLEQRISGASTSERVKLSKQLTKLQDQAEELRVYEEKIHHLADQMIKIDLDDGVKVNYAKFQDVLAPIK
ncbi:MAG: BREX-1 system adenine-specific DNA-methyltransferase PglX [Anaerolineaceae bacterium]|nr:BREX-1 system adenine-specific DNA-methyltransferase PglX [Anaerolineaceae bacterium]